MRYSCGHGDTYLDPSIEMKPGEEVWIVGEGEHVLVKRHTDGKLHVRHDKVEPPESLVDVIVESMTPNPDATEGAQPSQPERNDVADGTGTRTPSGSSADDAGAQLRQP